MTIKLSRAAFAWVLALLPAYFSAAYLDSIYKTAIEIFVLTSLINTVLSILLNAALQQAEALRISRPYDFYLALSLFASLTAFAIYLARTALQFPSLFNPNLIRLENRLIFPFALGAIISIPIFIHLLPRASRYIQPHLPAIVLSSLFFPSYLLLSSIFNQPAFDVDDIFFDADGLLWRTRFATDQVTDYYWRSVHPFVLILVKPVIFSLSLFLKGDSLAAAIILPALAGSLCVFLAWVFIRNTIRKPLYALLFASLLGVSAAHLSFSALIETYILLAAVILFFLVLLLKDLPLYAYILTSLISFGITTANFAHTAILFIFTKRDLKKWIQYGIAAAVLTIPLTLLNNFVYPNSQPYFFNPATLNAEADNTFSPSIPRGIALARVMFLHSIAAPTPLILEEEIPFLKVWISKADPLRVSEYESPLGAVAAFTWTSLFLFAVVNFLIAIPRPLALNNLKNHFNGNASFALGFIFILLFNFALHLRYGKDLFLYSTNWTYALILFTALACQQYAAQKRFQTSILILIIFLIVNNSQLIRVMLETSSVHLK